MFRSIFIFVLRIEMFADKCMKIQRLINTAETSTLDISTSASSDEMAQ